MAKITEGGDIDPIGVLIATGVINFSPHIQTHHHERMD